MAENKYCIYRNKLEKIGENAITGICVLAVVTFAIVGMVFPFAMMLGYIAPMNPDGTPSEIMFFGTLISTLFVILVMITGECAAAQYKEAIRDKKKIDDTVERICGYLSVPIFFAIVVPSMLHIIFSTDWGMGEKIFLTLVAVGGTFVLLHGTLSFLCEKENYRKYLEVEMPKATW